MTRKQRHLLTRIIVAAVLFLAGSLLHLPELAEMAVFLVCYVVVGWDIVWKAITNILHGQVFDENFLMTIATIGALILGEHSEGVAVMLFYQVGEWFQSYAVSKSRKSIAMGFTRPAAIPPECPPVRTYTANLRKTHLYEVLPQLPHP